MQMATLRRVDWVTLNFVASVWILIGGVVTVAFVNAAEFIPWDGGFAPFGGRILSALFGTVAVEALLWVFVYREAGHEARWAAGLMGGFLAIKTLIMPLYSWTLVPFYGYVSASQVLFAARGRR